MKLVNESPVNFEKIVSENNVPVNSSILNNLRDEDRTTEKYNETDDIGAIKVFNENNWFIKVYKQVKPHNKDKTIYRPYMATYKNSSFPQLEGEGEITLLQRGSKDGSKKFVINLGFFRWANINGLIFGNRIFRPIEIKHIGSIPDQLGAILEKVNQVVPQVYDTIEQLNKITLTKDQQLDFAKKAILLRYPKGKNGVTPEAVLTARKYENNGDSLWRVMNSIHENLMNEGSLVYVTVDGKHRRSRAVKSIELEYNINIGLWELSESYMH